MQADLTGGFDSRVAFIVALHSGINLNKMQFFSIKGTLHTYKEDYEIASKIANYYGFNLNQPLPANQSLNFSFSDVWNSYIYNLQTFHKSFMFSTKKLVNKCYKLAGYGGETIRTYWQKSPREYLKNQKWKISPYSAVLSRELLHSLETLIQFAFLAIREKYKIDDENCEDISQYLYQETRCRHHFGKVSLHHYFRSNILISPILDPELRTLQLNTPEYSDYNLLMALLFARFEPDLLKFPFQGKRSIAPETIAYAQQINERFPRQVTTDKSSEGGQLFHLQPRDLQSENILAKDKKNPNIPDGFVPDGLPRTCLKAMFESSRTYGLFTAYFNEELYNYAASYYESHIFNRFNYIVSVVSIAKVLEDVEISQRNRPLYQDMKRFLEEDFCLIHDDVNGQIVNKFSRYFTAKILIRMDKKLEAENLQLISVSDERARLSKPEWWQQFGVCHIIDSYNGSLEIVAKATVEGKIQIRLSGPYVPNPEDKSKRIPYWVDYTKLTVNGEVILDKLTPVWHDKPYRYTLDVKAGDEIKIKVEWLPHRSDT